MVSHWQGVNTMAFYNSKPLPPGEFEGESAFPPGWYFEHAATGEWIGPFADKAATEQPEREHYEAREPMPAYAVDIM